MGLTYAVLRPDGTKRPSLTPPMTELGASPKQAAGILNGNDGSRKIMVQQMAGSNNSCSNKNNLNYESQSANNQQSGAGNIMTTSTTTSPRQPISNNSASSGQPGTNNNNNINNNNSTQASTQVTSNSNNNNNNSTNTHITATRNLVSDFPRITSVEQRRRYKTEFDKDYAEYRQLHAIIEKVSNRFSQLEEELRNEANNDKKYKVSLSFLINFLLIIFNYFKKLKAKFKKKLNKFFFFKFENFPLKITTKF